MCSQTPAKLADFLGSGRVSFGWCSIYIHWVLSPKMPLLPLSLVSSPVHYALRESKLNRGLWNSWETDFPPSLYHSFKDSKCITTLWSQFLVRAHLQDPRFIGSSAQGNHELLASLTLTIIRSDFCYKPPSLAMVCSVLLANRSLTGFFLQVAGHALIY